MTGTLLGADTTVLNALDFTITCGAPYHQDGGKGCIPGDPASRLIVAPCCGPRLYVCEGRATYLRTVATTIHCSKCGRDHPNTAYRFPPIEAHS
jgi:hypothetical protein